MEGYKFPPTGWIWTDTEEMPENKLFLFRKSFSLEEKPKSALVKVSADTRYRLYVNGVSVSFGPCKGDAQVWYYEEVDIAPYLKEGENTVAASVLRLSSLRAVNHSIWRTRHPGLFVYGEMCFQTSTEPLIADETWVWRESTGVTFVPEDNRMAYLDIFEVAVGEKALSGWKLPGYDRPGWKNAVPQMAYQIRRSVSPAGLLPRPIPQMFERTMNFLRISALRESSVNESGWHGLLTGRSVTLQPNSVHIVEIDAGELTTGFMEFEFNAGKGAKVEIMTSESYVYEPKEPKEGLFMTMPEKGDRTDSVKGYLDGFTDSYTVGGFGNEMSPETYEPFWFRTFRFVRFVVKTSDEALQIKRLAYRETGYPLEVKTEVETSDESLGAIWDISLRSLRRCMHETYEDCPFYEQLQYAMDSRTQILFTYSVAADDRMARRCIDDFHRSLRHDGLTNCCAPTVNSNVIPGFSLYYIMMIHDHMMYFGDKGLVEKYLPTVDAILGFFARNIDIRGIVGRVGGVIIASPLWSFIDWTKQWSNTAGVPDAILEGPITMESFLYAYALDNAAELAEFADRLGTAEMYRNRSALVKSAINEHCLDERGLYIDGPDVRKYSQHCQVWAVLTETAPKDEWKYLMSTALEDKEFTKCSVAMAFYVFRALEKADMYDRTNVLWEPWREMVKNNLTTCQENDTDARSDCHAWGSLALYELPSVVLGVRPAKPGYAAVQVKPLSGYYNWAKGNVITPHGVVTVKWQMENGDVKMEVEAPDGVEILTS